MKNNIFINKYVMACAISIVIALVGYISMSTLPVEQYPDIAPPTVNVTTSYTGADENTVMKSVIQPLEEAINGVNEMTYMTSKASSNGDVEINVYFKQGADPDMATVNVQNRVTREATEQHPAYLRGKKCRRQVRRRLRVELYRYQHQAETDACHRCR